MFTLSDDGFSAPVTIVMHVSVLIAVKFLLRKHGNLSEMFLTHAQVCVLCGMNIV